MASTGSTSKQFAPAYTPFRGNSSNDWSDPDDFKGTDTVRFYVDSAAANDSANGLTDSTPKKTIAAGVALLRAGAIAVPGRPDQLLLKRGGTWTDETFDMLTVDGTLGGTPIVGRSATQRVVIGTYGTGVRPHVKHGLLDGIAAGTENTPNVAILGIDFDPHTFTTSNGNPCCIRWGGPCDHLLIEDCRFRRSPGPIIFSGSNGLTVQKNVVIRRNVFETIYGPSANWIRLDYADDGWVVEENHFDGTERFAWSTVLIGAGIRGDAACRSRPPVVRGNTFSNFGTHAIYLNGGAFIRDNLFISGANAIQCGNHYEGINPGFNARVGGVEAEVVGNYIYGLVDLTADSGSPYKGGMAILIENCLEESQVTDNIITINSGTRTQGPFGIDLDGSGTTAGGVPTAIRGVEVRRNKLYKSFSSGAAIGGNCGFIVRGTNASGQPQDVSDVVFRNNDIQEPQATTGTLAGIGTGLIPEVDSEGNRFWRAGPFNDRYSYGTGPQDLTMYLTWMGDSSSVEVLVPYPDPAKTIGDYHGTIGGTATQAAYVTAIRAQSRYTTGGASGWNDNLMAEKALAYFRANFAA